VVSGENYAIRSHDYARADGTQPARALTRENDRSGLGDAG